MTVEELKIIVKAEVDAAVAALKKVDKSTDDTAEKAKVKAKEFRDAWAGIGQAMTVGLTLPITAAGTTAVKFAMDLEKAQVGFGVLLGDMTKGKKLMEELRSIGATTPYETEDLSKAVTTMMQFGLTADEAKKSMLQLGDVAMGDGQKLQGLAVVFGQVASAGKLQGQDLMQLINQGFNPLQEIAAMTGKTLGELKADMEKGLITYDMVKDAFASATSEGGRFNGMMETMGQTAAGKLSTALDALKTAGAELGGVMLPAVTRVIEGVTDLAEGFGDLPAPVKGGVVALAGVTAMAGPVIVGLAGITTAVNTLKAAQITQTAVAVAQRVAMLALNPWFAAGAVAAGALGLALANIKSQEPDQVMKRLADEAERARAKHDSLIKSLNKMHGSQKITLDQAKALHDLYPKLTAKLDAYNTTAAEAGRIAAMGAAAEAKKRVELLGQAKLDAGKAVAKQEKLLEGDRTLIKEMGNSPALDANLARSEKVLAAEKATLEAAEKALQEAVSAYRAIEGGSAWQKAGKTWDDAVGQPAITSDATTPTTTTKPFDLAAAQNEYQAHLKAIETMRTQNLISDEEELERLAGVHRSYAESLINAASSGAIAQDSQDKVNTAITDAVGSWNELSDEIEHSSSAAERAEAEEKRIAEADVAQIAQLEKWRKEARDQEIADLRDWVDEYNAGLQRQADEAKRLADEADAAAEKLQQFREQMESIGGSAAADALTTAGTGGSAGDVVSGLGKSAGAAASMAIAKNMPDIGWLVGPLAGAAISLLADALGGLIDEWIVTEQETLLAGIDTSIEGLEASNQSLETAMEGLESTLAEAKETYADTMQVLEDAFSDKTTVLKDQWERGLITTEQFQSGMADARTERNNGEATAQATVDTAQAAVDANQAQQDWNDAKARKLGELRNAAPTEPTAWDRFWQNGVYETYVAWRSRLNTVNAMRYPQTTIQQVMAAANGADFVTKGPQLMMVGEAGTEHVRVTPAPINRAVTGGGGQQVVINLNGPVFGWEDMVLKMDEVRKTLVARRVLA